MSLTEEQQTEIENQSKPMTIKQQIVNYCDDPDANATNVIRRLSAAFNPLIAGDVLAIVNMICRCEEGDMEKSELKAIVTKKQDEVAQENKVSRIIQPRSGRKKLWKPSN